MIVAEQDGKVTSEARDVDLNEFRFRVHASLLSFDKYWVDSLKPVAHSREPCVLLLGLVGIQKVLIRERTKDTRVVLVQQFDDTNIAQEEGTIEVVGVSCPALGAVARALVVGATGGVAPKERSKLNLTS